MNPSLPSPEKVGRLLRRIPYAGFLGIEACREGGALTVLRFSEDLVGNTALPALHGGVIGSFLETVALTVLLRDSELDALPKTIDITIDYLRSGKPVDTYAAATILKRGRRIANVQAEAWQEDRDRPIAAARGNFLLPG